VGDCEGFGGITTKLYRYHEHFIDRVLKAVYPLRGGHNVLNHGDLWVNNIFFKYDSEYKVQQVKIVSDPILRAFYILLYLSIYT